jgi:diphosphomevalonate decarboxylase
VTSPRTPRDTPARGPGRATAQAHANIALVKYWGKRDAALNLPAAGSLSLTLDALTTTTTVELVDDAADSFELDGAAQRGDALARVGAWLDLVRAAAGDPRRARVVSGNDFPTAAGLASSASAFAALALAASAAFGLALTRRELSVLARRGSGSAARSIFGGLVEMHAGARADGDDAFAEPIADCAGWPLRMVIAVIGGGAPKHLGSRDAMEACADTSPLYPGWIASVPIDLAAARAAIARRDLPALGEVAERSALTMHATALASRPAILYFKPSTLAAFDAVRELRAAGVPAWATMDAGPHVKCLTDATSADQVAAALGGVAGVTSVRVAAPGGEARLL